jgi:hypothetical protein
MVVSPLAVAAALATSLSAHAVAAARHAARRGWQGDLIPLVRHATSTNNMIRETNKFQYIEWETAKS